MTTDNVTKPVKPVIIYDGECNFCLNGIRRIRSRAQEDQFIYAPRQTPDLTTVYPQLVEIESKAGMRFIDPEGKVSCGADAVYQIYRRLGKFRYITWIYLVPVVRTILRGAYLVISKNRTRLARGKCGPEDCSIENEPSR